jgi:hypothetical protein
VIGGKGRLDQSQVAGDGSTNIQAESVAVTVAGPTYGEVREIAKDVFEANFYRLAAAAQDLARERVDWMVDQYIAKLRQENLSDLSQVRSPDLQYALAVAQREYARSGERDLGETLVALLVDRTRQTERTLHQIALNESLETVAKLTTDQLDALSLIFLLRYTVNGTIHSLDGLTQFLEQDIHPFVHTLSTKLATYQHLEYSRCGSISLPETSIEHLFTTTYPGLFCRGFSLDALAQIIPNTESMFGDPPLVIRCLRDDALFQVNALNHGAFKDDWARTPFVESVRDVLWQLHISRLFPHSEVRDDLITRCPGLALLFTAWAASVIGRMTLTTVGMTIGHANYHRRTNKHFDLSRWL